MGRGTESGETKNRVFIGIRDRSPTTKLWIRGWSSEPMEHFFGKEKTFWVTVSLTE